MSSRISASPAHVRAAATPLFTPSRVFAAALSALACGAAFAQAADTSPAQEVVVSAARVEQKLPDTLPSTTLITRADIEASTATDVPGVLRTLTSFDVGQTGPRGSAASVFIRGSNSNQVLVLVDGAPLSRADFGSAPWELVPLDQIERIEVVRGNLSSLYGGQAVGGVVQIFTKRGAGTSVAFGLGNDGQFQGNGSIGARFGDEATPLTLGVSVGGQTQDGYDATDAKRNPYANPDADPSHQTSAAVRASKTWAPGQRTDASVTHSDTQSAYDSYSGTAGQDTLKTSLDAYSLQSHHALSNALTLNLSAGQTFVKYLNSAADYTPEGAARTRLLGADIDWALSDDHSVQLGVEDSNEHYSDTYTTQQKRETTAVRVGYVGRFLSMVDVQANLRHDDADDYGTANTGLLALGWRLSSAWKVVGQFSTAFSVPTFSDQLYQSSSVDKLKPERSRDLEFGVHWSGAGWLARATWFSQRQRDLIEYEYASLGDVNVGHAHTRGIELGADGSFGPGKLGLDATFQNARNDDAGTQLLRRARTSAAVNYRLPIAGWETGASVRYSGRRTDYDPVTYAVVMAPARTVVGLSTQHPLSPNWTIGAKVDNLFNSREDEVLGYTAPHRSLLFTLRGQWN